MFPSTKPDLHFDENGICGACSYTDYYENQIDGRKRKRFFSFMFEKKSRNKNSNYYDLIYLWLKWGRTARINQICLQNWGLNPLLVSFEPSWPTEIGRNYR